MRRLNDGYELSAIDLVNHLGCHHLTQLDKAVSDGALAPPQWCDPALATLQERGLEFEAAYLDHLRQQGLQVAAPRSDEDRFSLDRTAAAMRDGVEIIYQASLANGAWQGRADFLCRVKHPSQLGPWSYEVLDTKLALETRAGTILQLCLYSHMVSDIQGALPEFMHVVTPNSAFERFTYRVQDFLAYHRFIQRRLETAIGRAPGGAETYPEPVPQCDTCRWWSDCDRRRREDDHLCLVAGISRLQINEIRSWGVGTLTGLGELPLPLPRRPERGALETYQRVREQARIQLDGRRSAGPVHELLPLAEGQGLYRLPEPSPGDAFLDIESDPFVGVGGGLDERGGVKIPH